MYISCETSLLPNPLQNSQQHQHTCTYKKKNHVVHRFHYSWLPRCEIEILKPFDLKTLETNENYPFSKPYLHTQANTIFQSLKNLKENEDISFIYFN
jgi:hypothetical protein